ncbi:MAG: hypothetical protein GY820_01305 [Gammaproteobacteria bacterium]|nr:hypothetical protein [Gammaproteobacteria bacterium]
MESSIGIIALPIRATWQTDKQPQKKHQSAGSVTGPGMFFTVSLSNRKKVLDFDMFRIVMPPRRID